MDIDQFFTRTGTVNSKKLKDVPNSMYEEICMIQDILEFGIVVMIDGLGESKNPGFLPGFV